MNKKIYLEEITRLQNVFAKTLSTGQLNTWQTELEKVNIGEGDLSCGITRMIYRSRYHNIPFVFGELLKDCEEAKIERREREATKQKAEENKYRNFTVAAKKIQGLSPYASQCLALIKRLKSGDMTIDDYWINAEKLGVRRPARGKK